MSVSLLLFAAAAVVVALAIFVTVTGTVVVPSVAVIAVSGDIDASVSVSVAVTLAVFWINLIFFRQNIVGLQLMYTPVAKLESHLPIISWHSLLGTLEFHIYLFIYI